jgi:hypothetical protein
MKTITEWLASLKIYLQMSFFASSPARLPYSPSSIVLSTMAYLLVGEALLSEIKSLPSILLQVGLEIFIFFLISTFMLGLKKKRSRLLQTLSALIGVNLVISLFTLIVISMLPGYHNTESIDPLLLQLNLIILLWNLAVISLIFKRSFEIKTITAGFIAFNYLLLYEFIVLNFF